MYRFYSNPQEGTERVSVVGEHSEGVLKIAVSKCSKKDNFYRKKGRAIAEGRLNKGKLFTTINATSMNVKTFVEIAKKVSAEVITTRVVVNS